MAITQTFTQSFAVALWEAEMDFSSDTAQTYNIALYTDSASLNATTTAYTTSGEVATAGGYTAGGKALTISVLPTASGILITVEFSDTTWTSSSITASGALIYQNGGSEPSVCVIDFGEIKQTSNANFVVQLPPLTQRI